MNKTMLRSGLSLCLVLALAASARAQSGSLKVSSFPSGAEILVDGVDSGKTTPASVNVPPGEHTITVTAGAGWLPATRTITMTAGRNDLAVTLIPVVTTGPQGPKGDTGETPNYGGTFALSVNGTVSVPLRSFGGCFQKVLGVEFEDCYFSIIAITPEIRLFRADLTTVVATFQLFDITPVTLMPYGVGSSSSALRRTAVFSLSRFQLQ